jgi:hypothetical protein
MPLFFPGSFLTFVEKGERRIVHPNYPHRYEGPRRRGDTAVRHARLPIVANETKKMNKNSEFPLDCEF